MSNSTDKTDSTSSAGADPKAGRRRLLQGGLAAAPVLMTLVSRPVLGLTVGQCQTPSAFCSANASTGGRGVVCVGYTHGYWKNQTSGWPSPYLPSTPFDSVFAHNWTCYPNKSLMDVLKLTGGAPYNDLARDIVAALLNAAAGHTPVLSANAVKEIWSEYLSTGSYSPSSGIHWNHDQIIAYLLTTMA